MSIYVSESEAIQVLEDGGVIYATANRMQDYVNLGYNARPSEIIEHFFEVYKSTRKVK